LKPLPEGLQHNEVVVPRAEHLASAVGNRGVHVVSSPSTILFIEMACHHAVDQYLERNDATVGVDFKLEHCGAALPYKGVDIEVTLANANAKTVTFDALVVQNDKVIMRGQHTRAIAPLLFGSSGLISLTRGRC